jgi:hypothetical protein
MKSTMMAVPLSTNTLFARMDKLFGQSEVISRLPDKTFGTGPCRHNIAGEFEGSVPKPAPPSDHTPLERRCAFGGWIPHQTTPACWLLRAGPLAAGVL